MPNSALNSKDKHSSYWSDDPQKVPVTGLAALFSAVHTVTDTMPAAMVKFVVQDMDCFASLVWLIMRGDPITREVLAALTSSQVSGGPCLS